ncbi:MAG: serine/threonine protein kinase [Bdellovibrionaceae bacterium]|nr:serine/threonine protein kinase [Pseudobdellovibrionaceae bacterium]
MAHTFERFGKYVLLEKLASGGMAEVYLAKNSGANGVSKFVAIKRILPQYSDNEEFIEMFKEEAKIAVNLNHSNVVHIHEFGIERNQFYLVMEYVEGRNLRQILNELKKKANHFQIDQVVYIIKEVAAGLDHAHRCLDGTTGKPLNITHRDMSPQNVMVSFEGEIKIIDFGIAKAETQLEATKAGTLKGKFGYMSPEQADGQNIDLRTDVFSLGIVLWELLAKDRLFSGSSEAAILRKIRESSIPSLRKIDPSIHPELDKIVSKALAKDKNLRYQTAAALHRDLNRFLNTHYPEFSPQDFSVFIKHAFADAYSEQKGKLVEFSHVHANQDGVETNTITRVNEKFRNQQSAHSHNDGPQSKSHHSPILVSSGFSENNVENLHLNVNINENIDVKLKQREKTDEDFTKAKTSITSLSSSTPKTRATRYNFEKTRIKKESSFLMPVLLVGIIISGLIGYQYYMKRPLPGLTEPLSTLDPTECRKPNNAKACSDKCKSGEQAFCVANTQPKQDPKPAIKKYSVHFDSDPKQAEVYLDGTFHGRTPVKLDVVSKGDVRVRFRKPGYFDVNRTVLVNSDNMMIRENLQEERYALLIIDALGAGGDYKISINNETKENYQLRREIQVPANQNLVVEITNSLGFKATEKVNIQENTRRTIDMVLKKAE